jgi:FtsH-binding integral membrane protein
MEYGRQWNVPVADAPVNVRTDFIRKTYAHLGGAVLAFVALEYFFFKSDIAESILRTMLGNGRAGMLFVMLLFVGAGYVAQWFASPHQTKALQYTGLGLYIVVEAVVFVPILYIASRYSDANIIPTAGLYTAIVFGGLTGVVFITGKDFSFMRGVLQVASFAAIGLIVCSMLFGFTLGTLFSAAMIALAAGYILYQTSNVLRGYPEGSHVGASLQLFASVATLFYYILRVLMSSRR